MMYVDESGDCGLPADNSPTRYYCLSGVVVNELSWQSSLAHLVEFRRWIRRRYGVHQEDELHSAEMIGKPSQVAESFQVLRKFERLAILRQHADQLSRLQDVNIINVVVDKATGKLADKEAVFRGAWYRLFQRFENTIQHRNFPGPKNPTDKGMVFPDSTDADKLRKHLNRMRFRNPIKVVGPSGGFDYDDRPITSLIEDPIPRDSRHSYFVQAADCAVYLLKQHIEPSAYMKRHGGNAYFGRLEPVLCKLASYGDRMGIVRL